LAGEGKWKNQIKSVSSMTYENKLKTAYEHVISCFHKFLPINSLTKLLVFSKIKLYCFSI